MTPTDFPGTNKVFTAPADMDESQVASIPAYMGRAEGGSCDGAPIIVTAWQPSQEEIDLINAGHPIFLSFISHGLAPHCLSMSFETAKSPQ